jgi:hypothetical protein
MSVFSFLKNGYRFHGVAGDDDRQPPLFTEKETEYPLPQGDTAATDKPARRPEPGWRMSFGANADFQGVVHAVTSLSEG